MCCVVLCHAVRVDTLCRPDTAQCAHRTVAAAAGAARKLSPTFQLRAVCSARARPLPVRVQVETRPECQAQGVFRATMATAATSQCAALRRRRLALVSIDSVSARVWVWVLRPARSVLATCSRRPRVLQVLSSPPLPLRTRIRSPESAAAV